MRKSMIFPDLSRTASKMENASRLVSAAARNLEWASAAPLRAMFLVCSRHNDHVATNTPTLATVAAEKTPARRPWFCRKLSPSTRQTGTVIKPVFQTHDRGESNVQDFK